MGTPSFEDPVGTFTGKRSSAINQSINQSIKQSINQSIHKLADLIVFLHVKFPKRTNGLKEN